LICRRNFIVQANEVIIKRDALSDKQNWTGSIVSILDYDTGDELGQGIKMCNKALPDLVLLYLLKENYTWTGIYVKGPEEGGYHNGANGNLTLLNVGERALTKLNL